ncbi:MAG TPA: MarR family winged helix-turn-helix transcriptional regulator [Thermoleophilaceae bacterium]
MPRRTWTAEGSAATGVVLSTFRANGLFLAAGDLLAAKEGLTSARWQVMGAVALAGRPLTVPQVARRMGLTRQSVQASVNRLLGDGLVQTNSNPDHRRSPLIRLTELGSERYAAVQRRQVGWINELAAGLGVSELSTTARVLQELGDRLDASARSGGREQ